LSIHPLFGRLNQLLEINKVESVQRQFTKRLLGLNELSYNAKLSILNLDSLELRRSAF
jgi:hypothetical protein